MKDGKGTDCIGFDGVILGLDSFSFLSLSGYPVHLRQEAGGLEMVGFCISC
jgi:hypothetical protein